MSSLLVAQKLGQVGKGLVDEGETYQFVLLIGAAAAYVASAWWIVVVRIHFLSSESYSRTPLTVLPCGGSVPSFFYTLRRGSHGIYLPYLHRICATTDKHHRIVWLSIIPSLQCVALRV